MVAYPLLASCIEMRPADHSAQSRLRDWSTANFREAGQRPAFRERCLKGLGAADEHLTACRGANRAHDRHAGTDEPDIDGVVLMAGEELARAIERVDQQESLRHFVAV